MPRKGLTKEAVVDAAVDLIEEKGNRAFSLNEVARRLDIKPASLYNHVQSMEELTGAMGLRVAEMISQAELSAVEGKNGDSAVFALCGAYRDFAQRHIGLYKVVMGMQKDKSAVTEEACGRMLEPILLVLSDYRLDEAEKMHWQRILRAMMHGFIAHEYAGGFSHFPIDRDETYRMAIETILLGIHAAGKGREK